MISLRIKLVAYFVVLSLLPLAAAYWGFSSAAQSRDTGRADSVLRVATRATLAALEEETAAAHTRADALARSSVLQNALVRGDEAEIAAAVRNHPVHVVLPGGHTIGTREPGIESRIRVTQGGRTLGWVVAAVPFDRALAARLRTRAGLDSEGRVGLIDGSRTLGTKLPAAVLGVQPSVPTSVQVDGARWRVILTRVPGHPALGVAVLTPRAAVNAARSFAFGKLATGVAASLLLIALAAYAESAAITRTLRRYISAANAIAHGRFGDRVPARSRDELGRLGTALNEMAEQLELQRARLRTITERFGEALRSTHDPDQLFRVTVETAVETTGAHGGVIVRDGQETARVGDLTGDAQIDLPLDAGEVHLGVLRLVGAGFSQRELDTAASLAAHAAVALQNARLYEIVEEQARVDSLTGLPNRRACEAALEDELARAWRGESAFAFVLVDVDDFKAVNDTRGHLAGDRVLREFAARLRRSVRDVDFAGRWGGEEFALILPGTDAAGATLLVERVRAELKASVIALGDGSAVALTASFGIAAHPDETSTTMLVRAADAALYEAKRTGKDRVAVASPLAPAA